MGQVCKDSTSCGSGGLIEAQKKMEEQICIVPIPKERCLLAQMRSCHASEKEKELASGVEDTVTSKGRGAAWSTVQLVIIALWR